MWLPRKIVFVEYRSTPFLSAVTWRMSEEIASLVAEGVRVDIEICAHEGDVTLLPTKRSAFVSPANSLGFMDGGIDYVYSRVMFCGCERELKQRIRALGKRSKLDRFYLSIGSAIAVPGDAARDSFLISAPTMFLPHDVSRTRNAYHAFHAALMAYACFAEKDGIHTLVCPALCCGVGKMSEHESAHQIATAFTDVARCLWRFEHPEWPTSSTSTRTSLRLGTVVPTLDAYVGVENTEEEQPDTLMQDKSETPVSQSSRIRGGSYGHGLL